MGKPFCHLFAENHVNACWLGEAIKLFAEQKSGTSREVNRQCKTRLFRPFTHRRNEIYVVLDVRGHCGLFIQR